MSDFDAAFQTHGPDMIKELGGVTITYSKPDVIGTVNIQANPQIITTESQEVEDVEMELADAIFEFLTTDLILDSAQQKAERGDKVTSGGEDFVVTTPFVEGVFTKVACNRFTIPDAV